MAEKDGRGIRSGLIFASSLTAVIIYIAAALCINILFMKNIIPVEYMGLISKLMLFIIIFGVSSAVKGRVRADGFINIILTALMICAMVLCISIASNGGKIDTAGVIMCILISSIGCFFAYVKSSKYGILHKKRRKRKR